MEAFAGLEPLLVDGKPAVDPCFVEIPHFSETASEDLNNTDSDTASRSSPLSSNGACNAFDVDTFLQHDYRMQSGPFKPRYYKIESDLFPDFAGTGGEMLFVPSTVSSADGCQMRVERPDQPSCEPDHVKFLEPSKLTVKLGTESGGKKLKSKVEQPQTRRQLQNKTPQKAELSTSLNTPLKRTEETEILPETPTSVLSDLPIISAAHKTGDVVAKKKKRSHDQEAVPLTPRSPNLPARKTSRPKLSPSSMKTPKKLCTKKSGRSDASGSVQKATVQTPKSVAKPKKGRFGKTPKRPLPAESVQVLTDWTQSSEVIPYPDRKTKQELAASAHLTLHQVNNWLAAARNRKGLIDVPEHLKRGKGIKSLIRRASLSAESGG